jgi:hypothetical protein
MTGFLLRPAVVPLEVVVICDGWKGGERETHAAR